MAADPSYPLFPIAGIVFYSLMFLLLTTNFMRQSWNLGVPVMCANLGVLNLIQSINAILWANTSEVKAVIYCDIGASILLHLRGQNLIHAFGLEVTRLQLFTTVGSNASTMIVTRRLSKISASRRSVDEVKVSWLYFGL